MRLLLDSHVFVWAKLAPEKLRHTARAAIFNPDNDVFVSVATAWELWVKHAKRPIASILDGGPSAFLSAVAESGIAMLDIALGHAAVAADLPLRHRDPFDRMLIAQAIVERLTLVTADPVVAAYEGFDVLPC
ncbi:MAG: type II toxin-antitoxin system VapC family toxin [Alphaproteobacteria bacterium]|nr:type II toxin-antitoxin system VapC family toxin [Alphaproteobacteria bacterium]